MGVSDEKISGGLPNPRTRCVHSYANDVKEIGKQQMGKQGDGNFRRFAGNFRTKGLDHVLRFYEIFLSASAVTEPFCGHENSSCRFWGFRASCDMGELSSGLVALLYLGFGLTLAPGSC
jgi:hypothetical protein